MRSTARAACRHRSRLVRALSVALGLGAVPPGGGPRHAAPPADCPRPDGCIGPGVLLPHQNAGAASQGAARTASKAWQGASVGQGERRKARSSRHLATLWHGHDDACRTLGVRPGHPVSGATRGRIGRRAARASRAACHVTPSPQPASIAQTSSRQTTIQDEERCGGCPSSLTRPRHTQGGIVGSGRSRGQSA